MTFLPKDMASEVFDLIPIYIKPKTKVRIPEIIQKEVLDWLKSLDFTSLFEVFMITDYQITQTILQMTRKLLLSNQGYFLRTHKEVLRPIEKPEDFDRFFFSRKDPPDPPSVDFNKKLQSYQELIFSHLRIFEKDRRFDSLCFSGDFLTNSLDQLFEVFSFISGNELFKHVCKTDLPINDWVWEMPFWFSLNNYQSIAAWIVGLMEREVWKKFFQAKKKQRKKSGNGVKIFLNQDSVLIKKNDLLEFWKELDKANRRKILSESRIFLHELEQSRKLKPSSEATLAYYWQFLDSSNDAEFMESLFFTSLKQAEELIPVLNGLLLKELNARFSQKNAEELIKAEESEKNSRKKKKKKAQKSSMKKKNTLVCPFCPRSLQCEILTYSKEITAKISGNVLKASFLDILPEDTYDQKRSEYETSISVVSDTTRRCRFLSTVIKKPRCTSNSREKGLKNPNEDYNGRLMLAQSEITTLLDSNTDFESVADSIYDGSLKKFGHGKTKGIEPPVFNNKKERNLSHEKYEPMDQGLKTEEKKTLECDDFIEVKRKKSLKDTGGYITSSACKPSLLKAGNQKKLEKNGGMGKKNINNNNVINNNKNIIRSNNNINSSNVKYNSISINSNNNNEKTIINNKIDKSIGNTINNEKNNNPIDKNIRNSINNDKNTININNNEKNITSDKTINNIINNEKIINNNDKSKNIINNESNNIISLERINISINNEKNNINEKNQKTNTKNIINTTNNYIINEEKPIMNNVNKVLLIEQKLSKEISLFIEGMRPKIEELRILRGLVLKRLRFILACLFPRFPTDLRVYGSCATGLDLPSSDMDLGLRGFERVSHYEIPNILHFLLENIVFFKWVKDCKCIASAAIPVLKLEIDPFISFKDFTYPNPPINYLNFEEDFSFLNMKKLIIDKETLVKVDITVENSCEFEDGGFNGIRSSELINQWLGNIKGLKSVALIVKYLFNKKGFNNAYKGGFSSYCLMIILAASLRKLGCEFSSGMGLLRFIEAYGKEFDSKTMGIDLNSPTLEYFNRLIELLLLK